MKFFVSFLLFFAFLTPSFAEEILLKAEIIEPEFDARITVDDYIPMGKSTLFDASDSRILEDAEEPEYIWDFHDGERVRKGREQVFSFDEVGRKSISLTVRQGDEESTETKEVFVYQTKSLLITDKQENSFDSIKTQAAENGTWLKVLSLIENGGTHVSDAKFIGQLIESSDFIRDAQLILFLGEEDDGLANFSQYYHGLSEETDVSFEDKTFVRLTEGNFSVSQNIINRYRKILKVSDILLTRPEALHPLFESSDIDTLQRTLDSRAIEYIVVNDSVEKSGIFILSSVVSFFIESGIPASTIYLLLAFPFIAFIVTFSRQFIGFSTYGVYLPVMVSLSFFILGINFAFVVIGVVGIIGFLIRLFFNRVDMLHIPKVALTLSMIALSFFVIIWFAVRMEILLVIPMAIFPMLVISTMSEKFISAKSQEGISGAVLGMAETILVSFGAFIITAWNPLKNLILSSPEIILLPLFGIAILGRFTGLRITEYLKFRSILSEGTEE